VNAELNQTFGTVACEFDRPMDSATIAPGSLEFDDGSNLWRPSVSQNPTAVGSTVLVQVTNAGMGFLGPRCSVTAGAVFQPDSGLVFSGPAQSANATVV
jgi:hypothetical protein